MTIPEHGQRNLTMAERSLEISMATVLTESAQNILKNKMCSNGSLEFTKQLRFPSTDPLLSRRIVLSRKKQDAAHEPEYSHAKTLL
jgi:hypothetical protein